MGYKMNEGLLWAKPLESSYGYARRLMAANPGLSLRELRQALPDLPFIGSQCPLCADHLFHTAVYRLPSLTHCPIHHCELGSSCPKCHLSWGRPFRSRSPVCDKCGVLPKALWGKTQMKRRHLRKLRWLTRWVDRCEMQKTNYTYVSLCDIHSRVGTRAVGEHQSFFEPNSRDKYYLAFECQRAGGINQDRLNRMHIMTYDRPLKSRTSNLRPWPEIKEEHATRRQNRESKEHIHRRELREAEMVSLITLALRRILRWQRHTTGMEHRLTWSELQNVRPEAIREGEPPCDLCMAFSFWCCLINQKFTEKPAHFDTRAAHELFRFANYRQVPNVPAGVFIEDREFATWRPSVNFERWLFLRALENAFAEFIALAKWLFTKTANDKVRFKATGYHGVDHTFEYPRHPSQILETRVEDRHLVARYWSDSPLYNIQLDEDVLNRVRRCRGVSPSDWSFMGVVEPDPHELHQAQTSALLRCEEHPSRWLFSPWIERSDEGYFDYACYLLDFEVLRSSNTILDDQ